MRKRIFRNLSAYILMFLLFCTFVSFQVEKIILPQVEVSDPVAGTVVVDGKAIEYAYTIPYSAVEKVGEAYYAYYLQESNGRFGKEYRVVCMEVKVIAQDGKRAALKSQGFYKIVIDSDRTLEDDMIVMVRSSL